MRTFFNRLAPERWRRISIVLFVTAVAVYLAWPAIYGTLFQAYTGVINAKLHYDSVQTLSDSEFEALATKLVYNAASNRAIAASDDENEFARQMKTNILLRTRSFQRSTGYRHIEIFRKAGIRSYKGPSTCLECHRTISVQDHLGKTSTVNTMDDVTGSIHYQFQRLASGFSTYGYDGREVNAEGSRPIPVGKIDRACGIPGSFSWTGWAALIETKPEGAEGKTVMRSEGCGQCHIGGGYHPATERMMPVGDVPAEVKEGIDCLICHSQTYDMNYRHVIKDENGLRWNQDRSMSAAMTVGMPTSENCLYCHQHNMGGDIYPKNAAAQKLGFKNQRLLHAGAKRGNPWHSTTDVHAAVGVQCLDCHTPQGHKIPRGNKGTDLVANDLPGVDVSCERCHTQAPHLTGPARAILNGHIARVACESCHIKELEPYNVVLRDWVHPLWNSEEGIYEPTDVLRTGAAGKGFTYLWFNGSGTFLANALGTNPSNPNGYNPLMEQMTKLDAEGIRELLEPELDKIAAKYPLDKEAYLRDFTNTLSQLPPGMLEKRRTVIEEKLRPLMAMGSSRLYPFKLFNAMMFEDMTNQGPFGAMILPFDYKTYYETGKPAEAVKVAISNPIVKRMYEAPFKAYMMDEFMAYFGVDGWKTEYPLQNGQLHNVEPHWMRQMGTLMVNHGIQREARGCADCHVPNGVIDWTGLGYPEARAEELANLPELQYFEKWLSQKRAAGAGGGVGTSGK